MHCYYCGQLVDQNHKYVSYLLIQSATGKTGIAKLHSHCCCLPSHASRNYKNTVEWEGSVSTLANLKRLIGRIAAMNESSSGSIPLLLA